MSLAVSADGKSVGVGREDRGWAIWELATGKQAYSVVGHDSVVTQLVFTRDSKGIVTNADLAPVLWTLVPKDLPAVDGSAETL
jgi:hypothetical protein